MSNDGIDCKVRSWANVITPGPAVSIPGVELGVVTNEFALAVMAPPTGEWNYVKTDEYAPYTEAMKDACREASLGFELMGAGANWRHKRRSCYLVVEATDEGVIVGAKAIRDFLLQEGTAQILNAWGVGVSPLVRRGTPEKHIDLRRLGRELAEPQTIEFADDPRRFTVLGAYYKTAEDVAECERLRREVP